MEALQYLGIVQVFSLLAQTLLHIVFNKVIIGAMDVEENFLDEEEHLHFQRITSSLDFIVENY